MGADSESFARLLFDRPPPLPVRRTSREGTTGSRVRLPKFYWLHSIFYLTRKKHNNRAQRVGAFPGGAPGNRVLFVERKAGATSEEYVL